MTYQIDVHKIGFKINGQIAGTCKTIQQYSVNLKNKE